MNKLKDATIYLSGAIDNAKDLGTGWRDDFISKAAFLKMSIINPCNKPSSCVHEVIGDVRTVTVLREQEKWQELQEFVKQFQRCDLRFCDISDALIVYIDPSVPSYGTIHEMVVASIQKKPMLCIIKGGIKCLPTWLFGMFRLNEIFASVDECVDHLKKIDSGEIPLDMRWVLIRQHLIK